MNLKKKLFFTLLWSVTALFGRYHAITGEKTFEKLINQYPYAVVCFAQSRPEKGGDISRDEAKQMREDFKELKIRAKSASDSGRYDKYLDKEVGFLVVDVAEGKAEEIDDQFALRAMPTCLLFKRGKAYTTLGQYAQIFSPISKDSILSLLEKNVEDELDEIMDKKKEQERLDREERIERYKAYARYPYYGGWGYPYYGWGWGGYGGWGWYGGYRGCW